MQTFLERRSEFEETRAATRQNTNVQKFQNLTNKSPSRQSSRFQQPFTGAILSKNFQVQNSQDSKQTFIRLFCYICRGEHGVFACEKFLSLAPKARYEAAQKVSFCINSLRGTHHSKNFLADGCRKFGKRHNSLLHISQSSSEMDNDSNKHNQINTLNQHASNSVSNYQHMYFYYLDNFNKRIHNFVSFHYKDFTSNDFSNATDCSFLI